MPTQVEVIELDGVGQRTEGARFELHDATGALLGSVTPTRVVIVKNQATGVLKRVVDNFILAPSVQADVNTQSDRVWAFWRINGVDYPLGVFLFATASRAVHSQGITLSTKLLDQGLALAQPAPGTVGFPANALVTDCLASVFDQAGFHTPIIGSSAQTLSTPLAWPGGSRTTWAAIATNVAGLAGLNDWYFDNVGQLRVPVPANLTNATALLGYDVGGRIIAGSIVESDDMLDAPNRYIAIDSSNRTTPVYGVYDLPASAPNSYAARGIHQTKTIDAPGVGTFDAAAAYAQTFAQTDPKAFTTVQFSAPPDPRHDTFDVVRYLGVNYQELSWDLTCAPGGPHTHSIKRIFYT